MLATNTSSLLVTAVAATVKGPGARRRYALLQPPSDHGAARGRRGRGIVSEEALAIARAAGEAMGKHVIDAVDGPGFLVNRCNRPFTLEALKLLQERVASIEQIDRICRMGGGFRMGPFELMDLVGVDVNLDVARSFYEQSFAEPRWRPSPIPVKAVAAGRLGRKTGRGYYDYRDGTDSYREPDPDPSAVGGGDGLIVVHGNSQLAVELARGRTPGRLGRRLPGRGRGRAAAVPDPGSGRRRGAGRAASGRSAGDLLCRRIARSARSGRRCGRLPRTPAVRGVPDRRADPWHRDRAVRRRGGGEVLRDARQAHDLGLRLPWIGARQDRLPAHQRVGIRDR